MTTQFTLGINTGFATNRFPEADEWARIVAQDLGLHTVQLVADLLNPFWSDDIVEPEIARIQEATARYGIAIDSLMTSTYTRVNHLMYPYPEFRQAWLRWFCRFADFAARLGARAIGSHFGIMSVKDVADPNAYRRRVDDAVSLWQAISHYAREVGLKYVFFETMSVPREMGWTVAEARELRDRVNQNAGAPMYFCLDTGHAPHPDERDPYLWIRELAAGTRIVHLQQTEWGHSRHWPFTPEYNAQGIIQADKVLDLLAANGAEDILLAFEISHRERYEVEPLVIPELKASAAYWQGHLPSAGRQDAQR
jgi:sugar phosphate isomerase/epimerase